MKAHMTTEPKLRMPYHAVVDFPEKEMQQQYKNIMVKVEEALV